MIRLTLILVLSWTAVARAQTLALSGPGGAQAPMTVELLQALPQAEAAFTSGNPPLAHHLTGPLLWTILTRSHLVDPARHGDAVRQTLIIEGADHYAAIIAMGELSPEFENKAAILALTIDGKPLERPRAVIPNDIRGGRGVHDVVALTVEEMPKRR